MVEVDRLGALPLALDVWRLVGSGFCHRFFQCYGGHEVFVSVHQNNNKKLYTNTNCKIVNDHTNSTHDMITLKIIPKVHKLIKY